MTSRNRKGERVHSWSRSGRKLLFLAIALLATGCRQDATPRASVTTESRPSADASDEPLIVSAAASTKDAVEELAREFTKSTGTQVQINAGPSNALASQILAGAPADLFLSANRRWAEEVTAAELAAESVPLLTNQLVMVASKANPAQVREPRDLLSDRIAKVALAGEAVPAGMYADQALAKLGLLDELIMRGKIVRGQDVRSALGYVERGEAEAGIVYSTDVTVAPGIEQVYEFDPDLHDQIEYILVLTKLGASKPAARRLYQFLASPEADKAFDRFGFRRLR